ncbi:follistatin [Arctopsyche grandis]|uniref:follistatin n=1 Tax=Arctopsyche grandis TaxID=121162 RepID=UPI00406D6B5F
MSAAGRHHKPNTRPPPNHPTTNPTFAFFAYHLLLFLMLQITHVSGGICWASMERGGRCKELTAEQVTKEECCSASQPLAAAWSPDDLDSGALFFWRVLGGGVPCYGCRESCNGIKCGPGRRCAMRHGRPQCVCAPQCGGAAGARPGPVCGTDGRTYKSLCRLRKRACRRRNKHLTLDYYGQCHSSCAHIRCGSNRHCLVDQHEGPHCVKCTHSCSRSLPSSQHDTRPVCGTDGNTYPSACHLQNAACRAGRAIPLAYRGPCNPGASCGTIRCKPRQECLSDSRTGSPRCVTCGARCHQRPRRTLCATNNRTYTSWCQMLRDACATGYVIDTRHAGPCGTVNLDNVNTVLREEDKDDEEADVST